MHTSWRANDEPHLRCNGSTIRAVDFVNQGTDGGQWGQRLRRPLERRARSADQSQKSQWPKSSPPLKIRLIVKSWMGARLDWAIWQSGEIRGLCRLFSPKNVPLLLLVEPICITNWFSVAFLSYRLINGRASSDHPINTNLFPGRTRIKSSVWISSPPPHSSIWRTSRFAANQQLSTASEFIASVHKDLS